MNTVTRPARQRAGALLASASLVLAGVIAATATPAQAAIAAPTGVRATETARQAIGLTWNVTGENLYRVRFATNSAMTASDDTWDVRGNYFELTSLDANPTASAARLTPGKTYYLQVKAIGEGSSASSRANLSSYSKPVAVTTTSANDYNELAPVDLDTTVAGSDAVYASWRTRGPGLSYVLRYTDDPDQTDVLKWESAKFTAAGGTVTGLKPGATYRFRVRVVDSSGAGISAYSSPDGVIATPATTASPRLSVMTYNVLKIRSTSDWAARRGPLTASIKAAAPDVLGLQEATPSTWATNGKKQYADVIDLLGSQYSYVSNAGSSGTKLAYNNSRLTMLRAGVKQLYKYGSAERYAVYAVFRDNISNKRFFVVTTHLEPGTSSKTLNTVRIRQANEVLDLTRTQNPEGHPSMVIGDMNSSRSATPENGQYKVFTGAGFIDPLDNAVGSWASGDNATAEHLIDVQYNSANVLERKARRGTYPVGTMIDYMYTSPTVRVAQWRTIVNLDTKGSFVGTIPSDHNAMQMSVHLP